MDPFDRFKFDSLYVISDLHLGGEKRVENGIEKNFQIFDQGDLLEGFLQGLSLEMQQSIGLVINGDTVDFLAEPPATHFDLKGAKDKLNRIFQDPSFVPVWRALKAFVKAPNRRLAITLGNHDLELALPWVRDRLLDELSGNDEAVRSRIVLSLDGVGFRCRVGGASVLCVHGNEVDNWNVTDYESLRRLARDFTWGQSFEGWVPNAGTKLVIEVMNSIKEKYPFIDLLKPETEAAVPILLSLDPSLAKKLDDVCGVALKLGVTNVRQLFGFLGAEAVASEPENPAPGQALATVLGPTFRTSAEDPVTRLLQEAEQRRRLRATGGSKPAPPADEFLGMPGAIWAAIRGKPKPEIMRQALERLKDDRTYDLNRRDSWVQELDKRVGADVTFLLAGHTHLERAFRRDSRRGFYFNSGTWVRTIQMTPDMLKNDSRFNSVFQALEAGTMRALDADGDLVLRRPSVVCIWQEGNSVHGELRHAQMQGSTVSLAPVAKTRQTWG